MDFKDIQELVRLVSEAQINEVKIEEGLFKLRIRGAAYQSGKGQTLVQAPLSQSISTQSVMSAPIAEHKPAAITPQPTVEIKPVSPANSGNYKEIKTPMVGTFYRSAGPDKAPFVQIGDVVKVGQPICIIEAMKLFNTLESEVAGKIVKILVDDASPVEYDMPLFLVEPE